MSGSKIGNFIIALLYLCLSFALLFWGLLQLIPMTPYPYVTLPVIGLAIFEYVHRRTKKPSLGRAFKDRRELKTIFSDITTRQADLIEDLKMMITNELFWKEFTADTSAPNNDELVFAKDDNSELILDLHPTVDEVNLESYNNKDLLGYNILLAEVILGIMNILTEASVPTFGDWWVTMFIDNKVGWGFETSHRGALLAEQFVEFRRLIKLGATNNDGPFSDFILELSRQDLIESCEALNLQASSIIRGLASLQGEEAGTYWPYIVSKITSQ